MIASLAFAFEGGVGLVTFPGEVDDVALADELEDALACTETEVLSPVPLHVVHVTGSKKRS